MSKVTYVDRSSFGQDRSTLVRQKLLLSDKSTSVLTKVASVNKSMDVRDGAP